MTQYGHDIWLRQNGLPASAVYSVYTSPTGYIWLTTSAGLVKFDGARFQPIRVSQQKDSGQEAIAVVLETASGALWVGTKANGLRIIEQGKIREFSEREGIDSEIRALYQDSNGVLWVGTANGLFCYRNNAFQKIATANDYICGITQDSYGTIYIAHHAGVEILKNNQTKLISTKDGLPSPRVWSVSTDRQGRVWCGTDEGLCLIQNNQITPIKFSNNPSIKIVNTVIQDKDSNIWIGTRNGGLFRYANQQWSEFSTSQGLSNSFVQGLAEDREGSLWIATNDGLNRLKDISLIPYTQKEGLAHDSLWSITEAADGNLYFFSDSTNQFSLYQNGKFTNYQSPVGPSFAARDGSVWVAGTGGLTNIRGSKITEYLAELRGKWISCVGEDEQSIVVFVDKIGLRRFINGKLEPFRLRTGESYDGESYLTLFFRDSQGNLWAGSTSGLLSFKDGICTKYDRGHGLLDNWITSIDETSDGAIWVSTLKGGIARLKNGQFKSFTSKDGLFDDQALRILHDINGDFWISSPRGIFQLTQQNIQKYEAGIIPKLTPRVFGVADGMKAEECLYNGGSGAGARHKDGTLWFATKKGAVMIDPKLLRTNQLMPLVHIEGIQTKGKALGNTSHIQISPSTNEFEINYAALSLLAPEKVLFKYKLEGYDQDWVDAGNRRTAYFTHLPPGNYEFRVMACNNDGLWAEAAKPLKVQILPYFWQTWWFITCATCWVLMLAFAGLRLRERQIKKREAELSSRVTQRTIQLNQEIAERRSVESQLRDAQQFLQNVINQIPNLIFVKNRNGEFLMVNEALANFYGISVESMRGKSFRDVIKDEALISQVTESDRIVLEEGSEHFIPEHEITDAFGNKHWLQTIVRPFIIGKGHAPCILGISTDLSERKLLEDQLRHAQKLESIGQLAAGIAHEINSPTQFVNDNTRFVRDAFFDVTSLLDKFSDLYEAVKNGTQNPELISEVQEQIELADLNYLTSEIPHALAQSLDGVTRIAQIVQSIKDFAHPGFSEKVGANLNNAIESTVTVTRNEWKFYAEVDLQLDQYLPLVPCYLSEFNQVILNLIINATHAIAEVVGKGENNKGKIKISTRQISAKWVEIRISDTGTGIPMEIRNRIFDPFFTTKEPGKGTGQGLAISHAVIVEKHKGQIEVESEVGKGTTFTIRLPLEA